MSATEKLKDGHGNGGAAAGPQQVEVHCDYLAADDKIRAKFAQSTRLIEVKAWARAEFVPNPPSDKAYYLNDDKSRHRFTPEEEQKTLLDLGYQHKADLRLNEEQASG